MNEELKNQIQKWHNDLEHEKIIRAILEIPEALWDYDLIGLLARAYNNNNEYDKAVEQLLTVSERGENDAIWVFRLAFAYFYKDEWEKALELFERCKELNPDDQDVDYFIAALTKQKMAIILIYWKKNNCWKYLV